MNNLYGFTPLNLALDGSLDQFLDLYEFTKGVYSDLIAERPEYSLWSENDRNALTAVAIPMLRSKYEYVATSMCEMFFDFDKHIVFSDDCFKHFDFFDNSKVHDLELRRAWYTKSANDTSSEWYRNYYREKLANIEKVLVEDIIDDLDKFLDSFRCLMVRYLYGTKRGYHWELRNDLLHVRPLCTVFDARKEIDNRISERMKKRHSECRFTYDNKIPLTDSPLYLYDSLKLVSCNLKEHKLVTKRYHLLHADKRSVLALPVHYCEDCGRYMCGKISFSLFKGYYGKLMIETHTMRSDDAFEWRLSGESELHKLGYTVVNGSMSASERQNKLISILEGKRLSFYDVVATIEQNIRIFSTNPRMRFAVDKWKSDLEFVNEYMLRKTNTKQES